MLPIAIVAAILAGLFYYLLTVKLKQIIIEGTKQGVLDAYAQIQEFEDKKGVLERIPSK